MSQKIGRNAPCPCGSGKKYKQCCLKKPASKSSLLPTTGGYRFEPGAYGRPERGYVPALQCEEYVNADWHPQFLLANPARPFDHWPRAAELATRDLDVAFSAKQTGGNAAAGRRLEALGYKSVENYQVEDFRSIEIAPSIEGIEAFEPDDDSASETHDGSKARQAILNVVDEQIRSGEPEETALTLKRLVDDGFSETQAKELIACLIAAEIFAVVNKKREYDRAGYIKNLRRLPELPPELQGPED